MSGSTNPHIGEAMRQQLLMPKGAKVQVSTKDDIMKELTDAGIVSKQDKKKAAQAEVGTTNGPDGEGDELYVSKDCERMVIGDFL